MLEYDNLEQAVLSLSKSVSNFPVGAISLNDFKSAEERIKEIRKSLQVLNARLLMLKAQNGYQTVTEESEDDVLSDDTTDEKEKNAVDTRTKLNNATAKVLIRNMAIKLNLHSFTIQGILTGKQGDQDMQKKADTCIQKLFTINHESIRLHEEMRDALKKRSDLKLQCQGALLDYKKFLKEQEEIRNKKLQETNPQIARNKEKTMKAIRNINIMKKLIVDFIGASNHMLKYHPVLVEMLEEHKELVTIDTVLKMSQAGKERENEEIED